MNSFGVVNFSQPEVAMRKRKPAQEKNAWSFELDLSMFSKKNAYSLFIDVSTVLLYLGIFICFALLASSVSKIKNILEA